ncbi:MAG: hypothetical protein LAT77_02635 [Aliidiomarina sp.]|uniref:hypothetical protein n=1 Tax=Aliidiomarina sp. TaxID=1872439 RepID=UPI0025B90E42|nr:hypothetical protein [Aliidiomarina sp.]MCH8500789.1 hypothetical protein [Aliidiomarina sp.]
MTSKKHPVGGKMKMFEFSLRFDISACQKSIDAIDDLLFEAGCDDALVRHGRKGEIQIDYNREAESALMAFERAKSEVLCALPGARFLEAKPDYVSPSDIAANYQISRQRVLKIMQTKGISIHPMTSVGNTQIFRLASVMNQLEKLGTPIVDASLYEAAQAAQKLNAETQQLG